MSKINLKFKISNLKILAGLLPVLLILITATGVFAHAVVKPNTAGVGSFTDFSLDVPSEKDLATTSVKLMIPDGINSVTPIVKPGWKIEVVNSTKQGQPDDDGNVSSIPAAIVWSGGSVPAHQKDYFMFSTQVPSQPTELDWKVEQTYADGSIVSWTLGPNDPQPKDDEGKGPYSKTMVINDLNPSTSPVAVQAAATSGMGNTSNTLSIVAIVLAALALGLGLMKRKQVV